eukprot:scaffold1326_cov296-Prasinococcus_capsulatus_cf.AAC.9
MRCWVKEHPVVGGKGGPTDAGAKILAKEPTLKVPKGPDGGRQRLPPANFARANSALSKAKAEGVARFVQNPAHWGPMARAGRPLKQPHPAGAAAAPTDGEPAAKKSRTEEEEE